VPAVGCFVAPPLQPCRGLADHRAISIHLLEQHIPIEGIELGRFPSYVRLQLSVAAIDLIVSGHPKLSLLRQGAAIDLIVSGHPRLPLLHQGTRGDGSMGLIAGVDGSVLPCRCQPPSIDLSFIRAHIYLAERACPPPAVYTM
jgi:hypothetical protein